MVYITDAEIGESDSQIRLDLVRRLDTITGGNGGGVFVSLWEAPDNTRLLDHYSQDFTDDPLYPSIAVNGGFDPVNWYASTAADRYLFTNVKSRILYGQ